MPRKKKIELEPELVSAPESEMEEVEETIDVGPKKPKKFSGYGFSVIGNNSLMDEVTSIVASVSNRKKNGNFSLTTVSNSQKAMLPLPEFTFQYLFGNIGLPTKALIEVIGGESTGKSTLCMSFISEAVKLGVPCYYQECEAKPLSGDHVARIASPEPQLGQDIANAIFMDSARSLEESYDKMKSWVEVMRGVETAGRKVGVTVPLHVPLLVCIDPWGKLMSDAEAAGVYNYGNANSDKEKNLLTLSNLGHAKASHRWARQLPQLMDRFNFTLVLVQHQNTKIDMSGTPSYIPADSMALRNTTKVGGKGFDQLDSLQLILVNKGQVKNSANEPIGKTIRARIQKNSYGPENRIAEWDLINDGYQDNANFMDRPIRFDRWVCEWLLDKGYFSTKCNMKRYSSDIIGVTGAPSSEYYEAILSEDNYPQFIELCKSCNIAGY
jgi:RecA/RadA recombinase